MHVCVRACVCVCRALCFCACVLFLVSRIDEANATDAVARITGGRFVLLNAYVTSALKRIKVNVTDDVFRAVSTGSLFEDDDTVDVDELSKPTRGDILTVNPSTKLVTFNSRHVQTFFTETGVFLSLVCCRPLLARVEYVLV